MRTGICPFCGKKVDKFIMFRGDVVGCRFCGIHAKQTNADSIRAMTDEELAEFLETLCPSYNWTLALNGMTWFGWLKKEVQE